MKKCILKPYVLYSIVAALAFFVRLDWHWSNVKSPLHVLNSIPGLDMLTHRELGALFAQGKMIFTPYRFLVGLTGELKPLIIFQSLGGVAVAVLVAFIALRLTGNRLWALASGGLAALYAPALMYEHMVLQESTLALIACAALAAVLGAAGRRCGIWRVILAGGLLALVCTGRPVGVPWALVCSAWLLWRFWRRGDRKRGVLLLASGGGVLLAAMGYNLLVAGYGLPVYGGNLEYIATVGRSADLQTLNVEPRPLSLADMPRYAKNIGFNLLRLMRFPEVPDNLNYHFIVQRCNFGFWTVGPILLLPLALCGWLLAPLRGRRFWGMAVLALLLALPVAAFTPLGRYRLVLYPYFAFFAPMPFFCLLRWRKDWRRVAAVCAAMTLSFILTVPYDTPRRSADYFAWGLALQKEPRRVHYPQEPAASYFALAHQAAPGNVNYTLTLIRTLMAQGRCAEVLEAAARSERAGLRHAALDYYVGTALLVLLRPTEAAERLRRVDAAALPAELRCAYYFSCAVASRQCGDKAAARIFLERSRAESANEMQRKKIDMEFLLL